jgi:hypothetical protein
MTELQRLVLDYRTGELVALPLPQRRRSRPEHQSSQASKVQDLTHEGLSVALEALEGRVDIAGMSGFTTQGDIVLCTTNK